MPITQDSFARPLAFQRETVILLAEQASAIPQGWVISTPALPLVWALNQVRLRAALEFDEAATLAAQHQAELPYRQLVLEDEACGARLEGKFRAHGWRVDCEVTMVLAGGADRQVDTSIVRDAPVASVLELLRRWNAESWGRTPSIDEERQLEQYWRSEFETRNAQLLGVTGRSGGLAAITLLYSDGNTAQVEDVYTVPEERGQGFARALVSRAVELASESGHELTFIVADDYGWPKQLYARLGFEPVGRTWSFHR